MRYSENANDGVNHTMAMLTTAEEIRSEIYRALEILGADSGLLATVGSWGDTLDDEEVLRFLRGWNAEAVTERS
jgi:hypothetical protein